MRKITLGIATLCGFAALSQANEAQAGSQDFKAACEEFEAGKTTTSETVKGPRATAGALLVLTSNRVCDLAWSQLAEMETIDLSGKGIDDLTVLSGLPKIKELIVSDNQISNLAGIEGLTTLTKFEAANNKIVDLAPLANLKELRQLRLNGNQIEKVGDLSGHKELKKLWLSDNKVKNINPIAGLPNINEIAIKKNPLTKDGCPTGKSTDSKGKEVEVNEVIRTACKETELN